MFKISTMQNFTYYEDNEDKGAAIREKAMVLQELLTNPAKLEEQKQIARQYRDKLYPSDFNGRGFGNAYDHGQP